MKLTVIFFTTRPGVIDIAATSLKGQVFNPKKLTYELVVIDGYPGRVERANAEVYLLTHNIPLRVYTTPKAKTFPWSRTGFANAMNSGVLVSGGDYCLFLHDFTQLPADALARWADAFVKYPNTLISGVVQEFHAPKPDVVDDVMTWKTYPVPMQAGRMWVPETFELAYWGAPLRFFDDSNGIDERADFCSQFSLQSVKAQATALGYQTVVEASLLCSMIDHRQWDEGEWTSGANSPWRMKGVYSDVPEDPEWTGWGANPYNLARERKKNDEVLSRPVRLEPRFHIALTPDVPKITEDRPRRKL